MIPYTKRPAPNTTTAAIDPIIQRNSNPITYLSPFLSYISAARGASSRIRPVSPYKSLLRW